MTKLLYNFLGIHSLIIGMFTFFLPVLLLETGFSLFEIALFISITGGSFVISMYFWDVLRFRKGIKALIYTSFLLEIILIISAFFITKSLFFLIIFALIYGAFNCFFWITQRILFTADITSKNAGNKFGNIQIIAFLLVKLGIFIGSFLLENNYLGILLFITVCINIYGFYYFYYQKFDNKLLEEYIKTPVLTLKEILSFKDNLGSRAIFVLDGPFLFFESFFWLITLFFIANQSYSDLGILVIFLAVSFSFVFFFLKKKVDAISAKKILYIGVILYVLSWFLRSLVGDIENINIMYVFILIIAFFTSFFRLVFNKQFFHTAKYVDTHKYMLIKSYYSQGSIFIVFLLLSILFYFFDENILRSLNILYFVSALFGLLFLLYRPVSKS